jgi:hypothetical protein
MHIEKTGSGTLLVHASKRSITPHIVKIIRHQVVNRFFEPPLWEFSEMPDGRFICTCSCSQYDGQPVDKLFRIEADGALDTSFHTGFSYALLGAALPLQDGRVYAGGLMMNNDPDTLRLMRLLPDGSRDPTFISPHIGGEGGWWPYFGTAVFEIFPFRQDQLIVAGQFTTVNGEPRGGICMIDTNGTLLPEFAGTALGPFTYQGTTNAVITNVYWANADSTALYICGTYAGYNDGTVNDTLQRFVSRLLVQDMPTSVTEAPPAENSAHYSIMPNPARGWAAFNYNRKEVAPGDGMITVREVTGKIVATLPMQGPIGQQVWDTRSVAPGAYMVEFRDAKQLLHAEKLIVQ